jgi:antitoxin PrlF
MRMDARAKMTSKGQVTIPQSVREALALHEGDELLFRVERSRALIAKTPDFLELAGTVAVPAGKHGTPWDEVLSRTRAARAGRQR